jgi:hypothetical protein
MSPSSGSRISQKTSLTEVAIKQSFTLVSYLEYSWTLGMKATMFPLKRQLTLNGLHGIIITTAVRISNATCLCVIFTKLYPSGYCTTETVKRISIAFCTGINTKISRHYSTLFNVHPKS